MPAEDLGAPAGAAGTWRRALHVIALGIRAEPRLFAIAVAGSVLYGVMTAAMAQAVGYVTRHQVTPAVNDGALSTERALAILGVIGGVVLLNTIGTLLRRIGGGFVVFNVGADYRRRVTRQYLRLPLAWHHRHPSGQLLSNANADVEATWQIFMPLPMAMGVLVMLVAGAIQMVLIDPVLSGVGLLIFPLLFAANAVFQRRMSARVTRVQQLRAEVAEVAHESFDGALVVKVMGREDYEARRFAEVSDRLRAAAIEVGRTRGTFDPVIEAIPTIGTLAVLALGVHRVATGAVSTAELVQFVYLISVLAFPVRAFGWVLGEVPRTLVGWQRVSAVLGATGAMTYGASAPPSRDGRPGARVEVTGVSYAYAPPASPIDADTAADTVATAGHDEPGGRAEDVGATGDATGDATVRRGSALEQVDLQVAPGTTLAIVGPTGSGKSTLASLLIRLIDPTTGTVSLDGIDLRELQPGAIAQDAALVPQQTFVFDDSVRGNITLGMDLADDDIWAALRIAQADRFVARLPEGLDTRVGERGASLSGGQRQRIALARALVRRPRLLVLDDATSAVDPTVEQAILGELGAGSGGMTLVVVAYRLSTIALADEVAHLEDGRLLDHGTHDELMGRCAGYARLVTAYAREAAERAAIAAGEESRPSTDDPVPSDGPVPSDDPVRSDA